MVYRNVEESLNLVGMQIHGDDTVCTGCLQHVRHQFGTDGYTRFVFAILTCPTEIRDDSHHFVCTRALGGINHEQKLHEVVAAGAGCLNQIDRLSANGLLKISAELTVGEAIDMYLAQLATQLFAHTFCQGFSFRTRKDFKLF